LDQAQRNAEAAGRGLEADNYLEREMMLDASVGPSRDGFATSAKNHSSYGFVVRGLIAALEGNDARARRYLQYANAKGGGNNGRIALEALLLGNSGQSREAAAMMAPVARMGEPLDLDLSPSIIRFLGASAFERAKQPDSAAAYYALALDRSSLFWQSRLDAQLLSSFSKDRLAKCREVSRL